MDFNCSNITKCLKVERNIPFMEYSGGVKTRPDLEMTGRNVSGHGAFRVSGWSYSLSTGDTSWDEMFLDSDLVASVSGPAEYQFYIFP